MTVQFIRIDHHDRNWSSFLPHIHRALRSEADALSGSTAWIHIGWLKGPHALIGIESTSALTESQRHSLLAALTRVANEHPSQFSVDEEEWQLLSRRYAREDLIEGPYTPLEPDNQVEWVDQARAGIYLSSEVTATVGKLVAVGLDDAIEMLSSPQEKVNEWALTGMAALADAYQGGGIGRGYLSYLSHWKEFLFWQPSGEAIERRWSEAYDEQKSQLTGLVREIIRKDGTAPSASGWRIWVDQALDRANALARSGAIGLVPEESWLTRASSIEPESVNRWAFGETRGYSDFHSEFRKLDTTRFHFGIEFASYRFAESVQFRLLLLAGVDAAKRCALSYFLCRAVEDVLDLRWQETVAEGIRHQLRSDSTRNVPESPLR
ncbi:MAG: hypothetical protein AAGC66_00395 [Leifsonia sp.]